MPIYMDLHIVPGITAKGAAEAHRQDLLIQSQYNCTCMTYWVDESKDSAFCLIEAPDEDAVRILHDNAHGLITHQIIQVNKTVVESFLGRIYDPETTTLLEGQLKVFNDPAFRVLVLIKLIDPNLLNQKLGKFDSEALFSKYYNSIELKSVEYEGVVAEHNESVDTILSFTSSFNAVSFALVLYDLFSVEDRILLNLRISINAGMPVSKSDKIFGDTITLGEKLLLLANPNKIILAPIIKEIAHRNFFNESSKNIYVLSPNDEKLYIQLLNVLEENISNESFGVDAFCRLMALSKSSLNRATQSLAGISPNTLLQEYRLSKAFQLLVKNGDSISEIAFKVGFRSPSYFSKCFKERYDISPSEFVSRLKANNRA